MIFQSIAHFEDDCGTGVAFTRNPATGEKGLMGEFLMNAQGEDVVAGVRTPMPIELLFVFGFKLVRQFFQIVCIKVNVVFHALFRLQAKISPTIRKNSCLKRSKRCSVRGTTPVRTSIVWTTTSHKPFFAGSGVTRERNAGAAIVAHVAERHHLNVYGSTLKELANQFKAEYKKQLGKDFPDDPKEQLFEAIKAVFRSWDNPPVLSDRLH